MDSIFGKLLLDTDRGRNLLAKPNPLKQEQLLSRHGRP